MSEHTKELIIVILAIAVFFLYVTWQSEKEDLKKEKNIPVELQIATEYCLQLKYKEETWKQEFSTCLKETRKDPITTLKKMGY